MAYNYYPNTYQAYPQYPTQPNAYPTQVNVGATQPTQNNGIIWVVGEGGADSYLVAPGQTVLLWDSTAPVLYLKTADSMGRPSKKILEYKTRDDASDMAKIEAQSDFASKNDVESIKKDIEALKEKLSQIGASKK